MAKEDNSYIVTTIGSTGWIRAIKDGLSSRISLVNLASEIESSLTSLGNQSKVRGPVTSSQAALATDNTLLVDSSGGNITITLPNPSTIWDSTNSISKRITVSQAIAGGNTVTVTNYGGENVYTGGAADVDVDLTGGASVSLETDGTDYYDVG